MAPARVPESEDGGEAQVFRLLNELKLIKLAVSLEGTESLAEHPEDLIANLEQALEAVTVVQPLKNGVPG